MKRGCIFFDFDGTISDAKRLTYETFCEVLEDKGYKYSKLKLRKLMGAKTQEILKCLNINPEEIDTIRKEFFRRVVKKTSSKTLSLCADVGPLYELKQKGYKLIVVSNSEKSFLKKSIAVLKIRGLFDKVCGSKKLETKDKLLKNLLEKYKVKAEDSFYVGDRFSDVDYAHKSKMVAVAIHNECSWSTRKEILKENPDYVIGNFEDLKKIVLEK